MTAMHSSKAALKIVLLFPTGWVLRDEMELPLYNPLIPRLGSTAHTPENGEASPY